jgi:hypothetical protein
LSNSSALVPTLKSYAKQNKDILFSLILALAGYLFFLYASLNPAENPESMFLPAMPPLLGLFIILICLFAMHEFASISLRNTQPIPNYIMGTLKNHSSFEHTIPMYLQPILSLLYRIVVYTGIYCLIVLFLVYRMGLFESGLAPGTFLLSGILISCLFETVRIAFFLLVGLLQRILSRKIVKWIIRGIIYAVGLGVLVLFLIHLIPHGDSLAAISYVTLQGAWDMFWVTRWMFDMIYLGLGYHLGNAWIGILITLGILEGLLYGWFLIRQKGQHDLIKEAA